MMVTFASAGIRISMVLGVICLVETQLQVVRVLLNHWPFLEPDKNMTIPIGSRSTGLKDLAKMVSIFTYASRSYSNFRQKKLQNI